MDRAAAIGAKADKCRARLRAAVPFTVFPLVKRLAFIGMRNGGSPTAFHCGSRKPSNCVGPNVGAIFTAASKSAKYERFWLDAGDPYGTRTRVFAVRGRRPRPLDEGAMRGARGGAYGARRAASSVNPRLVCRGSCLRRRCLRRTTWTSLCRRPDARCGGGCCP